MAEHFILCDPRSPSLGCGCFGCARDSRHRIQRLNAAENWAEGYIARMDDEKFNRSEPTPNPYQENAEDKGAPAPIAAPEKRCILFADRRRKPITTARNAQLGRIRGRQRKLLKPWPQSQQPRQRRRISRIGSGLAAITMRPLVIITDVIEALDIQFIAWPQSQQGRERINQGG